MKILVSGFEPFGGSGVNPSQEVLRLLPERLDHPCSGGSVEVVTVVIPTTMDGSMAVLREAIDRHQPDAVLSIGQAGGRADITLEAVGTNEADFPIPDNDGKKPQGQVVIEGAPDAYFTSIPNKKIVGAILAAGVPASISRSAGTYVCNYVCFGVCDYLHRNHPKTRSGFMHIPYLPSQVAELYLSGKDRAQPSMSLETIALAVKTAILAIYNCIGVEESGITGSTH